MFGAIALPAQEVLLEPLSNLKTTKKFPELWAHPSSQSLWKFLGNFSRRKKNEIKGIYHANLHIKLMQVVYYYYLSKYMYTCKNKK